MLSRVADSLYWMSRYLERAEHTVRMLDVNMGLMLDKSSTSAEGRWKRVLAALGNPQDVRWENDYYQLVHSLTFDPDIPASVTSCLIEARENARQVRDEISSEQWQQLNRMYHWVIQPHSEFGLNTRRGVFSPRRDRWGSPLPGGDGYHHEPRRGVAVYSNGPLPGAGGRH